MTMTRQSDDPVIVERVAALDLGKAELVCCIRCPDPVAPHRRVQQITTFKTMTKDLTRLAETLVDFGTDQIWMEATSDYWRAVFYRLEAHGLHPKLTNARDAKHLPGRSKTDVEDAMWLCKLAEKGLLRESFVQTPQLRYLRDLTRDRVDLIQMRQQHKCRVEKLLDTCCIKLSVVATDIFGVSGRAMMNALVAGERDPVKLAELAQSRLRTKIPQLHDALTGFFTSDDGFRLKMMLELIDTLTAQITAIDTRVELALAPYTAQLEALATIPGVDKTTAAVMIGEFGVDMSRFPTSGRLASWAKLVPRSAMSAGKRKGSSSTGKGNTYLSRALGNAAVAAGRTSTFLGERHRRLKRRRGNMKAVVATGHSIIIAAWHILATPHTTYKDLGTDHYKNRYMDTDKAKQSHIRALEHLGYTVTVTNPTQ